MEAGWEAQAAVGGEEAGSGWEAEKAAASREAEVAVHGAVVGEVKVMMAQRKCSPRPQLAALQRKRARHPVHPRRPGLQISYFQE